MSQSSNDALRQYNENFRRISEAQNASDTSIPPAGCFTLYENNDYKGCKVTRCANQDQGCTVKAPMVNSIGQCGIMPCADNCGGNECFGFSDKTSSIKVGEGTVVTLYKDNFHKGDWVEYGADQPSFLDSYNDTISSWKAKIDCNNNNWRFSQDCLEKKDHTINTENIYKDNDKYCKDKALDSNCKQWCKNPNSNCTAILNAESCLVYGNDINRNNCLISNNVNDVNKYYYAEAYNSINGNNTCKDQNSFCYDDNLCSNIVNIDDTVLNSFINWIKKLDNGNITQIRNVYKPIRKKTFYNIQSKLCNTDTDNIFVLDKIGSCGFQLKNNENNIITGIRSLEEKLFSENLYNNLLKDKCDSNNRFNLENNELFKYTEDPYDEECMNNWTLYEKNKTSIVEKNIPNITKLRDNKSWCPKRSNNFHTNICNKLYNGGNIIDNNPKYQLLNQIWKDHNCYENLPHIIFSYLEKQYVNKWDNPIDFNLYNNYFINELKQNNNIFARKLCYSGDTLENGSILYSTNHALYSNNGLWRLVFQTDGNLVLYDGSNAKWSSNTKSIMINKYSISECTNWANNNECVINPDFMLNQCAQSCNNIAFLSMQSDNNLVIYNNTNQLLWESQTTDTSVSKQKAFLVLQNDGKLVMRYNDGSLLKVIYPENSSPFENHPTVNVKEYEFYDSNNYIILLYFFLVFIILICCNIGYKYYKCYKKNKTKIT
jgi:hypothetical protein